VVLIKREDDFIIPRSDIILRSKDRVLIAADSPGLAGARRILEENPIDMSRENEKS
jgi:Trk K+ transport system NAD-binding subunit